MATYATYFHQPTSDYSNSAPIGMSSRAYVGTFVNTKQSPPAQTPASSSQPAQARSSIPSRTASNNYQQTTSLFFRFPPELRNMVYRELLCPDAPSRTTLAKRDTDLSVRRFNRTTTKTELHPAILSTCRRIHDEATELLYTPHTFHAHPTLLAALPHLQSASKPVLYSHLTSLIKRWQICLRLDTDPLFTFAQATQAFSGADYLEIRVWQAQYEACNPAVLKLFTGIRGVKVARVGGSVDSKFAQWLEQLMMRPMECESAVCGCENEGAETCPSWECRREILCGRCYKKLETC